MGQIDFDKMSFKDVEENKPGSIKNHDMVQSICELLGIKNVDNFTKILLNSVV